jgi:hypothetical protein
MMSFVHFILILRKRVLCSVVSLLAQVADFSINTRYSLQIRFYCSSFFSAVAVSTWEGKVWTLRFPSFHHSTGLSHSTRALPTRLSRQHRAHLRPTLAHLSVQLRHVSGEYSSGEGLCPLS